MDLLPEPQLRKEEPFPIPDLFKFGNIFPDAKDCLWIGSSGPRSDYEILSGGEIKRAAVISICSDEEKIIVRAFQDWFAGAIRKFAGAAKGYWTFETLKFAVNDVPRSWDEFAMLLTNHAAKMQARERRLIQFGALYGVLHHRAPGDTGKAEARLNMEFWKAGPEAAARKIQKQKAEGADCLILRDISRIPLCPPEAAGALQELLAGKTSQPVWYLHENSARLHSAV